MDGCAFLRGWVRRECWKPREKLGLRAVCRGGVVSTKRGYWWCSVVQCEGVDNCARCHKMGQSTFVTLRLQLLPLLSDRITIHSFFLAVKHKDVFTTHYQVLGFLLIKKPVEIFCFFLCFIAVSRFHWIFPRCFCIFVLRLVSSYLGESRVAKKQEED